MADEIQRAEYTGKYQVYKWDVTTTTTTVVDGTPITTSKTEQFFCCEQVKGEYTCGDLADQLPFREKLDEIFGKQFKLADGSKDKPGYKSLTDTGDGEHDLLVKLEGTFPSDSAPKGYEVPKEVTVRVKLDGNTHHILLTAWEGNAVPTVPDGSLDLSKTMQAELVAKKGTTPVLDYNPGTRTGLDSKPVGDTNVTVAETVENKTAAGAPMQWELHWIRKGAVSS